MKKFALWLKYTHEGVNSVLIAVSVPALLDGSIIRITTKTSSKALINPTIPNQAEV